MSEEFESLGSIAAYDEWDDAVIRQGIRKRDWGILPTAGPGCCFLDHRYIVGAPPEDAGLHL